MIVQIIYRFFLVGIAILIGWAPMHARNGGISSEKAGCGIVRIDSEKGGAWTACEREIIDRVILMLPEEYRNLKRIRILKKKGEGEKKPVSILLRRREIHVGDCGNSSELKGMLVGELSRFLDHDLRISERHEWRRLSRWTGWDIFGNHAENTNKKGFAEESGRKNPGEDFVVTARFFFASPEYRDPTRYLKYRLPSKYRFMQELFRSLPDPQAEAVQEEGYRSWIDPGEVEGIELLVASPSYASIASIAGHLSLLIRKKGDISGLSKVVSFVADTIDEQGREDKGIIYVFKGIFGGYRSILQEETLSDLLFRQTVRENRDVYRLKIDLDRTEIERFVERLWEIRNTFTYRYYFFNRNCTTMFLNLINDILPPGRRIRERDWMDLPANMASLLYRRDAADFVHPSYWSLGRQSEFAERRSVVLREKIAAGVDGFFSPEAMKDLRIILAQVTDNASDTVMEKCKRLVELYTDSFSESEGRRMDPGEAFFSAGVSLMQLLHHAHTRVMSHLVRRHHRLKGAQISKKELRMAPELRGLAGEILRFSHFLRQNGVDTELAAGFDAMQREVLEHERERIKTWSYGTGYARMEIIPSWSSENGDSWGGIGVRFSTISQPFGCGSVFSFGDDTALNLLSLRLDFRRRPGAGKNGEKRDAIDVDFTFINFGKIIVSGRRAGRVSHPGIRFAFFHLETDRMRGVRKDFSLAQGRFLWNLFSDDDFHSFLNLSAGCGFSLRRMENEGQKDYLDLILGCDAKIAPWKSPRLTLRFSADFSRRIGISSTPFSQIRGEVRADLLPGLRSNMQISAGVSCRGDMYPLSREINGRGPPWVWNVFFRFGFPGRLFPPKEPVKRFMNRVF